MKPSPHYGPSLVFLLGALVIAGAIIWQGQSSAPTPPPAPVVKIEPLAAPKPLPAECDTLLHYNPNTSPPLYGKIASISGEKLEMKMGGGMGMEMKESLRPVVLTSATQVVAYDATYKPAKVWQEEVAVFNEKFKNCDDGKRAYMAPEPITEKAASLTMLKPGQGIQVMLDDTIGDGKTAARFILVYPGKQIKR